MINFRFHIVSLTAVLLALGVGLVLGTTFLDDATVNQLERQLDGLEADLDRAQARNDELSGRVGSFEDEAAQLDEQIGERLFDGQLQDDPVLVVATRGVDGQWVDGVLTQLAQADADVAGVWWLTDRLVLDDDSEVADLSTALQVTTDDADRLRHNLAVNLSDVLFGAVGAPGAGPPDAATPAEPAEPALLARLREAGFVEYQMPDGADADVVVLPADGLRIVVVDGTGASVPHGDVVLPLLTELSSGGPVSVVATQPTPQPDDQQGDDEVVPLVTALRDSEDLKQRISTVDDLDRVAGRVALILAAADAVPGSPVVGHYGMGDGADRLLPAAAG
ncbi:MAG TPA: copper transporter [Acidimicrobiales bacterium]|nr:copper transporter [Acidimicrobiales bacterium]